MASDVEDDDLDNLRKAALATLKPKAQPISSISSVSRTHPQPNSAWLEFPVSEGIVLEYQFQPEPLPEPDLHQPRQNVSLPPQMLRPHLSHQGWPVGFNYMMQNQKTFQPRGYFGDRRPFNMRAQHRSFGDRGRPMRDRGRHPRRGYVPDQGRGFFSRGRGRPTVNQFQPTETESAGGNLIVINPQLKHAEENKNKNNITANVANNGIALSTNHQVRHVESKLLLPQDKYHSATCSAASEKTSSDPTPHKPRDKFSRYDDSDSEEDDDWIDNLIEADNTKIDKFLEEEEEEEADTRVVEQQADSEEETDGTTTEGTYEVEIRKLELSDNEEEEESRLRRDGLLEDGCSPITSDNESVDLDALAGEDLVPSNSVEDKISCVHESLLADISLLSADVTQDLPQNGPVKLEDVTDANETASNLLSSSSSTSSSSSSSSSSGESSSECDDNEGVDLNEPLKKSPPPEESTSPKENVSPTAQEHQSESQQHNQTTPSYENTASLKRVSPVRRSDSPPGPAGPRTRRSPSPQKAMSPPRRTSWSPRQSRSKSPINSSSNRSPQTLSYKKRSVSPRRSHSPRRISPRRGPSPKRFSPRPYSIGRRSPSPRRLPSPRQRSPSSRRPLSPRRRSPLPLRSISPRRRSPLPLRSISPRRRSPLPLRTHSPRRSPLPLRPLSPRRTSPLLLRSISPRRRSPLPLKSISPRRRSPLPLRSISPRRRSPLPSRHRSTSARRSLSPGQRTAPSQRLGSPRQRSVSPRRHFSPRRSESPSRSSFSSKKRSRSPVNKPVSPHRISSASKPAGYPHNRNVSHGRQELCSRDYRTSWHQDGKRYGGRNNASSHISSSHSTARERGARIDSSSKYHHSRQDRKYAEPSSDLKDSREKVLQSPLQQTEKRSLVKAAQMEEPAMPQIDLDKLTPEERAKIEARRKKFSEVKIDPAKKVSLKSIKERTKKRKKSQQEVPESVPEKRVKGNHKSGIKQEHKSHTSGQGENSSSAEDDEQKAAVLDDDSEDSDAGRLWKLEASKTGKQTHRLNIPGKSNHSPVSREDRPLRSANFSRQGRNVESHNKRHHRERHVPEKFREKLAPTRSRVKHSDEALSEDNSDETVAPSRLTSSIVSSKSFPLDKLQVKIRVASSDRKSKKHKVKPDFSQVYSVPAKRHIEPEAQTKATEVQSVVLTKKAKKKKKDKKKVKHEKELPDPAVEEDDDSEAAVEAPAPRVSVLDRLGKKVPFKPHKEKKKKKKKRSHTDEENPSELDVKMLKMKERNAAIARRQQEIELDKKMYG